MIQGFLRGPDKKAKGKVGSASQPRSRLSRVGGWGPGLEGSCCLLWAVASSPWMDGACQSHPGFLLPTLSHLAALPVPIYTSSKVPFVVSSGISHQLTHTSRSQVGVA